MPMWKYSLREAAIHPIAGWGLDSFRNNTPEKPYTYVKKGYEDKERMLLLMWDNPHNLYISLIYEWGIFGIILLVGYWKQMAVWYYHAPKSLELVAMAAILIGTFFVSIGHFPFFLSRLAVIIIVIAALFEVKARTDTV
jgi:O-antigen ligase